MFKNSDNSLISILCYSAHSFVFGRAEIELVHKYDIKFNY